MTPSDIVPDAIPAGAASGGSWGGWGRRPVRAEPKHRGDFCASAAGWVTNAFRIAQAGRHFGAYAVTLTRTARRGRQPDTDQPRRSVAYLTTTSLPIRVYPFVVAWMFPFAQNHVRLQTLATATGTVP